MKEFFRRITRDRSQVSEEDQRQIDALCSEMQLSCWQILVTPDSRRESHRTNPDMRRLVWQAQRMPEADLQSATFHYRAQEVTIDPDATGAAVRAVRISCPTPAPMAPYIIEPVTGEGVDDYMLLDRRQGKIMKTVYRPLTFSEATPVVHPMEEQIRNATLQDAIRYHQLVQLLKQTGTGS